MGDLNGATNASLADERHSNSNERQPTGLDELGDGNILTPDDSPDRKRWLLFTSAIVVLFWISYFAGLSAMIDLANSDQPRHIYIPRAVVTLAGILISLAIVATQTYLPQPSLARRAVIALVAAVTGSALQSAINIWTFNFFFPGTSPVFNWRAFATDYAWRMWIWVAACGMILALSYASDIRERERRILAFQNLAHSAQLRALRFQLNPHFLFNALNSIAGLISARRAGDAQDMTENLADFLRFTLALDPQKLITLEQELELQSLYLEIEKKRFPDRLAVRVDVPPELGSALVPSLITQPLIENSIKYAVARSTRPVELAIIARKRGLQLELIVADSGGDGHEPAGKGACLGLRNVAERIRMHYGDRGTLSAAASAAGGFRNQILIPVETRG